jgi:hypothetical protein
VVEGIWGVRGMGLSGLVSVGILGRVTILLIKMHTRLGRIPGIISLNSRNRRLMSSKEAISVGLKFTKILLTIFRVLA